MVLDRVIGGFRIVRQIKGGSGSQGTIYEAVCEDGGGGFVTPGTKVALKIMPLSEDAGAQMKRLKSRTSALMELSHPNIVRYIGCFAEQDSFRDLCVVVQEFLDGETLKDVLARSSYGLDVDVCVRIADAVISALCYASGRGIVHRDVKPANVFICNDGTVKLIDFEVARAPVGATASSSNGFQGSFDYMAPEFASSSFRGDVQSDVFSMGVMLHEMLTGQLPYLGDTTGGSADFKFMSRWAAKDYSPVRIKSKVKKLLSHAHAMLSKALAQDRTLRYRDFNEFKADLSNVKIKSIRNGGRVYQLLQFIGKGGFGEVFKARIKETGQVVAVKHLLDPKYVDRFVREARIMGQLDNPCFVRLVDSFFVATGGHEKEAFLVMDFLDGMPGSSLRDAIRESHGCGLDPIEALRAFSRYAQGLFLMHSRGIFHRDIKPSNLYYPKRHPERAVIMDLGIARDVNGTVTHGQVPGTLDYMPPEIVTSGSRGESGMDIYALGLCLYEALTGKMAYPRLPTGSAAYAVFFNRSKERSPPDLEEARKRFGNDVYSLLKEMTEPELSRRMKKADELVSRLNRIIVSMGGVMEQRPTPNARPRSVPPQTVPLASPPSVPRPPKPVQVRRPKPIPRRPVHIPPALVYAAISFISIIGLWALFGNAIKLKWAEYELDGVIESWRKDDVALAEGNEARWLSRWSPVGYGWRRIANEDFTAFTNQLAIAKTEIRNHKAAQELELARASERRVSMERLSGCRKRDGSLDEEKYMSIDGWSLPSWLEGEREVAVRLYGLDQSIVAAINAKLALEPVDTRRRRIKAAKALAENSWTGRLLSESDRENARMAIEAASRWCVATIRNNCSDVISVDGTEIAIGGSRVVQFKDGRPGRRSIVRAGYKPKPLPHDIDGKSLEVGDDMLEAFPVRVDVPFFENGISCRIDDRPCRPRESIELTPGLHECVYARNDYVEQRISFTVHVNVRTVVPEPSPWKRTEEYLSKRRRIDGERRQFLSAPVSVYVPQMGTGVTCLVDGERREWGAIELRPGLHSFRYERSGYEPQEGRFDVKPGEPMRLAPPAVWETEEEAVERKRVANLNMLQNAVREKCKALWANEPVRGRQERLEEAGVSVAKAIFDGVLTEEEAQPLLAEVNRRKKWAVGKVKNGCKLPISVGGRTVAAGDNALLLFENGIPNDWFAEVAGYERKQLLRDFDGCELAFDESDFVPLDVEVRVPVLDSGVICQFAGTSVPGTMRIKPGTYTCIYKRRGYAEQRFRFEVRSGQPMELPPPSAWRAR